MYSTSHILVDFGMCKETNVTMVDLQVEYGMEDHRGLLCKKYPFAIFLRNRRPLWAYKI